MAGKGVSVNEGFYVDVCVAGGHAGGSGGSGLDGRSDRVDYGRYYDRDCNSRVGRRYLRVQGCSSDGSISVAWGRALFGALALCLVGWVDVSWAVVPTLLSVTPVEVVKGSTGVSLAIQGAGFDVGTVGKWGVVDLVTTVYGTSAAVVAVPDSVLADVGVGVVTLVNADGSSNGVPVPVVESFAKQLEPVLYVAAGLLGAMAFIWGMGMRW